MGIMVWVCAKSPKRPISLFAGWLSWYKGVLFAAGFQKATTKSQFRNPDQSQRPSLTHYCLLFLSFLLVTRFPFEASTLSQLSDFPKTKDKSTCLPSQLRTPKVLPHWVSLYQFPCPKSSQRACMSLRPPDWLRSPHTSLLSLSLHFGAEARLQSPSRALLT